MAKKEHIEYKLKVEKAKLAEHDYFRRQFKQILGEYSFYMPSEIVRSKLTEVMFYFNKMEEKLTYIKNGKIIEKQEDL